MASARDGHSHEERQTQRREAARRIARGESVEDVAKRFGRSVEWAIAACKEHGLDRPRRTGRDGRPRSVYIIVARLFDPAVSYGDIARELRISRQRVAQVYAQAVAAGIPVPERPVKREPLV